MRQRTGRMGAVAATLAAGVAIAVGLAGPARAGLGEGVESLARDRAAVRGVDERLTPMAAYDLHEMPTADGGAVREYVSRSGVVFGVAWNGRTKPDLSALLGAHYADYLKAAARPHVNHKVLSIEEAGFVMVLVKMPRGFSGTAHVPTLLPDGVAAGEVR